MRAGIKKLEFSWFRFLSGYYDKSNPACLYLSCGVYLFAASINSMGEKTLINEAGECGPYQPSHAVYFLCDVFYHFVVNGGFTWIRLSRCVAVCFLRVCGDGCRFSRSMVDLEQLNGWCADFFRVPVSDW